MSLPNEKITRLIHDIHNFRLEIERIRNDTQICDGLKNIQISFVQTLKPPMDYSEYNLPEGNGYIFNLTLDISSMILEIENYSRNPSLTN